MDSLASITASDLALSKNPIIVNVDPASPTTYPLRAGLRYLLEVYTPKFFQSSEYALLTTLEASEEPPVSAADLVTYAGAYFDLAELLHTQLDSCPPEFGQVAINVCDMLTTSYYCKYKRFDDETLIDSLVLPSGYVYRGGIGPADYADFNTSFFTRYTAGRKFLTYKPNGSTIRPDQPEFLTFLTNFGPVPAQLRLRVEVLYEDLTRATFTALTATGITANTAYCIPVGMVALGLLALPKTVLQYDVWLSNASNGRLSEVRTYQVEYAYAHQVRYILFENSLGGFDTLPATGNGSESLKVVRQFADRFTGYDFLATAQEQVINRVTGERQLSVSFGYPRFQADAQRQWWQELYFSEQFYIVTDREHIALTPTSDSYLSLDDNEDLIGRSMSFRYTNAERSFSRLPILPPAPVRATGWRGEAPACEIDGSTGLRTNIKRFGLLVKYYLDNGQDVKPYTQKANNPGTTGYIASWTSDDCAPELTTYLSAEVTGLSTLRKSGCATGYVGTRWTMVIPEGSYGSETSQADADARAQTAWLALDTQANADLYGSCVLASPIPLGLRNDCPGDASGFTGSGYNPIAAVILDSAEVIPNTTYDGSTIRYADNPIPAATYTIDVRVIFSAAPTLPYRIRIPSKSLVSPVFTSNNTYRFANVVVAWGDDELIVIVEPA